MLIVVIAGFQRTEVDLKFDWDIGLENCGLRVDLEDCHVLTIQVLSLLSYPEEAELALKLVGDLYFSLPTQRHYFAKPEFNVFLVESEKLILLVL